MKLDLSHKTLSEIINGEVLQIIDEQIDLLYYDSRKINTKRKSAFFAFHGRHKDGHVYCENAYKKGVRCFIVSKEVHLPTDCTIIKVEDTLYAYQEIAKYHRTQFNIPVLAITGSFGKTTIKEWLYYLLKDHYNICRTPNSYNSQIGVAQSLLELNEQHELAIFEADISHPDEMERLEEIISPTLGLFTGIGSHYAENFESQNHHLDEHLKLFTGVNTTLILNSNKSDFRRRKLNHIETSPEEWNAFITYQDQFPANKALCLKTAEFLGLTKDEIIQKWTSLPILSGRQEVFEGINNNLIINDTYNIDIDALEQSLEYQFSSKERNIKIVVLNLFQVSTTRRKQIIELVERYKPDEFYILNNEDEVPLQLEHTKDALILFKGSFKSNLSNLVQKFKNRKHETWVEFDLKAILHNYRTLQGLLPKNTKILVMVKASSYGTGDVKIPHFLQEQGADYLGVAYTDEGATLRENGIIMPILVMNTETNALEDIIRHELEPSIYSYEQLADFIDLLESKQIEKYPIHIKFETGMNRLGFNQSDIPNIMSKINSSTAVEIKSVFSHLANADDEDNSYSLAQIAKFNQIKKQIDALTSTPIIYHILNSEGIAKFAHDHSFDMVRFGIGIFGYLSNDKLPIKPSLKWMTTIAQVKTIKAGETIGYGRSFIATQDMQIATLRIGYADGFRRALSNGKGKVFIKGEFRPVVGNVCMDMTMIDVTGLHVKTGDLVEIIGANSTMNSFANLLSTIPYEVMTNINKRVAKLYIQ